MDVFPYFGEHQLAITAVVIEKFNDRDVAVGIAQNGGRGVAFQRVAAGGELFDQGFFLGFLFFRAIVVQRLNDNFGIVQQIFLDGLFNVFFVHTELEHFRFGGDGRRDGGEQNHD